MKPNRFALKALKASSICLLALALTACGSIHKRVPGWAAPVRPPAELTAEVPEPVLPEDADNGALAEFASDLQAALREANRRLRAIRGL